MRPLGPRSGRCGRRRTVAGRLACWTRVLALATSLPCVAAAQQAPLRVVAVGDAHGDLVRLRQALRAGGVLGEDDHWAGGESRLVLVGDLVDRGPASHEVVDLVARLAEEAPGRVHALLGNHEALTVMRDARYVAPTEYRAFAVPSSEALRQARWEDWVEFLRRRADRLGFEEPAFDEARRREWLAAHPPGFFERWEAFGPEGRYGRWIRGLDAAAVLGTTLFVHGGLSATRPLRSIDDLNRTVRQEIAAFDARWRSLAEAGVVWPHATWSEALALAAEESDLWSALDSLPPERVDPAALRGRPSPEALRQVAELLESESWTLAAEDGPLWARALARDPEERLAWVPAALESLGVARVAVGHTPTPDHRIVSRLEGRVLLLDSGLSEAVGGRPSALVLDGDAARAVYPEAPPEPLPAPGGDALLGLSLEAVESFLRTAGICGVRRIGRGVTKPSRATLSDGELRHDAAVQSVHACEELVIPGVMAAKECDSWRHNVAAYEIAKLLGLDAVVPSVARPYDGRQAAFTWWIDDAMTFDEMKASGANPPDGGSWNRQQWRVGVFDELIYNTDRNQGNLLVDHHWRIWMIDHSRAFRADPRPRNPAMLARLKLDATLGSGLRALDAAALEACCADLLEEAQREALLARRDTILARLEAPAGVP